jgi:hypothetical protein
MSAMKRATAEEAMPASGEGRREPLAVLPTRRMLVTIACASLAAAGAWALVVSATGRPGLVREGAAGAALVALVSSGSALAIRPWRARAMGAWAGPWLGGIVARLLLTPALAWLIYSAAPLGLVPLMLSVAVAYVAVQISEAAAVALHLKRLAWST